MDDVAARFPLLVVVCQLMVTTIAALIFTEWSGVADDGVLWNRDWKRRTRKLQI